MMEMVSQLLGQEMQMGLLENSTRELDIAGTGGGLDFGIVRSDQKVGWMEQY